MSKRRYTTGYMIYGCEACKQGFKMYLEESLEDDKFQPRKPVPFVIKCPFCGELECRDVSFKKIKLRSRQRIRPYMPAFINVEGDPSGVPINMKNAEVEFTKRDPIPVVTSAQLSSVAEALNDASK